MGNLIFKSLGNFGSFGKSETKTVDKTTKTVKKEVKEAGKETKAVMAESGGETKGKKMKMCANKSTLEEAKIEKAKYDGAIISETKKGRFLVFKPQ